MPRDLPVGNGSLLINFDSTGQVRDIFWPHAGQENHTSGRVCRLGVWVDNRFSWLNEDHWQRKLHYSKDSLATNSTLENKELQMRLLLRGVVDFHENLLVRQITVENLADQEREIRVFCCHDLSISGTTVGDSAYFDPETGSQFHYKGKRWFMISLFRGNPGNKYTPDGSLASSWHAWYSNEPLSVSPLTWSHATHVDTLLKYHKKDMELVGDNH